MHVKVCGLKHPENMTAIDKLNPDFIGMIFHPASLRFVGGGIFPKTRAKKVGVFVDSPVHYMDRQSKKHDLDYLQLHGNEPLSVVKELADKGFRLIKTFSVSRKIDIGKLERFAPYCRYFLFDTKGKNPGGNGQKFNWKLLENYPLKIPFFLSGGIAPEDVESILDLQHPKLAGIDLNSGFEREPGLKNENQLKKFIHAIRK